MLYFLRTFLQVWVPSLILKLFCVFFHFNKTKNPRSRNHGDNDYTIIKISSKRITKHFEEIISDELHQFAVFDACAPEL